ncbi:MAG: HAMP domain-containing histidine kinase [Firmicutes bacterium]|nr:HAMP domain-containing histidine kinase [Bacillota bacterium]
MSGLKSNVFAKTAAFLGAIASVYLTVFWTAWGMGAALLPEYMLDYMARSFGLYPQAGWPFTKALLFGILSVVLWVYLLSSSGHHEGVQGISPGWANRVPFDVIFAAACAVIICSAVMFVSSIEHYLPIYGYYPTDSLDLDTECEMLLFSLTACSIAILTALQGLAMSFACRVKPGGWYKNTVCYFVISLIWRFLCFNGRLLVKAIRAFWSAVLGIIRGIPLVWKGTLLVCGLAVFELVFYMNLRYDGESVFIFWLIEHALLIPLLIYVFIQMRRLEKGGERLASGELGYHVNTSRMIGSLKRHGEDLNSLADGMNLAVEDRLKSERFKTELITNVSHDIKTPLTSIINYSELISRGDADEEQTKEYAGVLKRQSEKLKRLLEDLVEASKASTGNLEVVPQPCDAKVFVDQLEGEYKERTDAAGLSLVCSVPEAPVRIMADGRRMWRVLDNLMNNACKYSQPGTRIYVDLTEEGGDAVISFRNTSAAQLNIPADMLIERFVRGDEARHTEGSGLGLSIARSLTELQGGKMEISVDGDLFKVMLRFPKI